MTIVICKSLRGDVDSNPPRPPPPRQRIRDILVLLIQEIWASFISHFVLQNNNILIRVIYHCRQDSIVESTLLKVGVINHGMVNFIHMRPLTIAACCCSAQHHHHHHHQQHSMYHHLPRLCCVCIHLSIRSEIMYMFIYIM